VTGVLMGVSTGVVMKEYCSMPRRVEPSFKDLRQLGLLVMFFEVEH
jgi:hypothetical protein